MKRLHYKQEMKYLNAVAEYLTELGYEVIEPNPKHRDLLDVYGTFNGRRCFVEIYVTMWACDHGINGVWNQGEHDGIEMYMDNDPLYGLDTREHLPHILDGLKPMKRKSAKKVS